MQGTAQWLANPWEAGLPKMTMTLRDADGEVLVSHAPDEAQVWTAGFAPDVHDPSAGDLQNVSTVTFPDPGMYEAFYDTWKTSKLWSFDKDTNTATLRFRRRKWAR